MDLEMQVERTALGVARVADEPEHVAGVHDRAVDGKRRIRRKVSVVELVAAVVAQPQPPSADLLETDLEHDSVRHGEDRGAERREDVVAVVPAVRNVLAHVAEPVAVGGGAVDGKDVPVLAQGWLDLGRFDLLLRPRDGDDRSDSGWPRLDGRRCGRRRDCHLYLAP